jgi:hypothetical protein
MTKEVDEMSAASAGSQPVAWAVEFDGEVEPFCLSFDKGKAIDEAGGVGRVVALYRSPTLTDEERQVIFRAMYRAAGVDSAILWSLLERTK